MSLDTWVCPNCGEDSENCQELGANQLTYFSAHTYIFECPHCGALIEDSFFISMKEFCDGRK